MALVKGKTVSARWHRISQSVEKLHEVGIWEEKVKSIKRSAHERAHSTKIFPEFSSAEKRRPPFSKNGFPIGCERFRPVVTHVPPPRVPFRVRFWCDGDLSETPNSIMLCSFEVIVPTGSLFEAGRRDWYAKCLLHRRSDNIFSCTLQQCTPLNVIHLI